MTAGTIRPRSRSAVLRGPGAARPRSSPPLIFSARRRSWLASPRTRTRACGFSRQARGKRAREKSERVQRCSRSPRSPKETHSSPTGGARACGKANQTTTNIPSRGQNPCERGAKKRTDSMNCGVCRMDTTDGYGNHRRIHARKQSRIHHRIHPRARLRRREIAGCVPPRLPVAGRSGRG